MKSNAILVRATTKIISDTRRALNDGTYPIKIRVTSQRKQVYYSTPYSLSQKDFADVMGYDKQIEKKQEKVKIKSVRKTKAELKEIGLELRAFENKAAEIIKELSFFTFESFEKHFLQNRIKNDTIGFSFEKYITSLQNEGRVGTAIFYECTVKSLEKFKPKIKFTDITPELLRNYEKWMLDQGRSITTIGMYLRHLRSIFNFAISEDLIPKVIYPFGKSKYEIPTGNNKKKAIPISDIGKIFNYKIEPGTTKAKARDFFLFIYLCQGINPKDLCLLKYKNIQDDILYFNRAKTIRTKRKLEPIRAVITEDVKKIIKIYGNRDQNPDNYIFPILIPGLTPKREKELIHLFTRTINDYMKVIAIELSIKSNLTTYTARHAYATIMKRSGASTSFISEALGHSNESTTARYLAQFEDSQKIEAVKALTAFKKNK